MYESIRIIADIKPKYVLWENVKNLLSKKHKHNFDNYIKRLDELGYNSYYQVLDAKDYGIPQHRERVYTISIRKDIDNGIFKFPEPEELKIRLRDILENEIDEKYYLSESNIKNINRLFGAKGKILNLDDFSLIEKTTFPSRINQKIKPIVCPTLTSAMGTGGGNVPVISNTSNIDKKYYLSESKMYNPYNDKEITNIAPTQTTSCGSTTSSAAVLILKDENMQLKIKDNIKDKRLNSLVRNTEFQEGKELSLDTYNQTTNDKYTSTLTQPNHNSQRLFDGYRIRKLTPRECWRLMSFSDEDFNKAKAAGLSDTQLYKQAGNSIVVNVLCKIFKNLF